MPYPDLGTMYQNGMGSLASSMAGRQIYDAQAMNAEDLRTKQMANDQSAVMNPLNAQFRQGEIARQGAELPGVQGQSASLKAKGDEDTQLLSAKVAEKLSTLATQVGNNGMVQMGQDAEKLSHAASIIGKYPSYLQKEMFIKAVKQYGGNVNSPMFQVLMQAPEAGFHTAATTLAQGMTIASQKYQQERALAAQTNTSHEGIAAGNNRTAIRVAEIHAASREAAAKARASMIKHMTSDQQLTALTAVPVDERTPEEQARILELSNQRIAEHTASANAVPATVLKVDTPQAAGQKTAAAIHGAPKAATTDFESMAKQQNLPYDPSKFKYRIGPNGQLQSAPK